MKLFISAAFLLAGLALTAPAQSGTTNRAAPLVILLDGARPGRVFEGIGAVSAGASSRLLMEYPRRQRREVLDYLFKPHYGAGFQHLKVEIGGEVNSTDGIEPTHLRSRNEENDRRGYEWWLMTEAKKRNPGITLDCLAWGAPGWIGGGHYYSADMADYIVKFVQAAHRTYGLQMDYTGIWNETPHKAGWIKDLRVALDQAGLGRVGIVAADDYEDHGWKIVKEIQQDGALRQAVARIGAHYPETHSTAAAQAVGIPLWASEDGPWRGDWPGAVSLARTLNRNYINGKFTKTEIWSPVTAYYDSLPLPGSGVMRANEPWSGHYEVQPAVWAVAHTTQFAPPGWHYLDSACALIPGGSCVALASPEAKDFSIILETMDGRTAQTGQISVMGLPVKQLQVWRTTQDRSFERLPDLQPVAGHYALELEPHAIYSLTTTTGQRKGTAAPPAAQPLALPYADDFSSYATGSTPRYFSDQAGVFEVVRRADGRGMCLQQVVTGEGIQWPNHKDPEPETLMGDLAWSNYVVAANICLATNGYAALWGRISLVPNNENPPSGYRLKIDVQGGWELRCLRTTRGKLPWEFHSSGQTGEPLAQGRMAMAAGEWHRWELGMEGDAIAVTRDGVALARVRDATHGHGQAGLGSGWAGAQFARFEVRPANH